MKLFTKLASLSVGLAMAVGVGIALSQKADEVRADSVTITPSNSGWSTTGGAQSSTPFTGITISTDNGAYNTSNGDFRVYKNNSLTVASTVGDISLLEFTYNGSNNGGWAASYTPNTASWTSPSASGTQARITQLIVTTSGGSTTTYTVTYSAGENGSGSKVYNNVPEGNYTLLPFNDLSTVKADSGYRFKNYTVGGVDKNPGNTVSLSADTTITVNFEVTPLEGTYDFVTNFSTYTANPEDIWGGYAAHSLTGTQLDAGYEALISFDQVSKQTGSTSGAVYDRPVVNAKVGLTSTMKFVLDSAVSATYKITSVNVQFKQWTSKVVSYSIYKGQTVSGDSLDSGSAGTKNYLSVSNLNSDSFIVNFTSTNTSNTQLGVTSITIGLTVKESFGTLDHIKVSSNPDTTIYHVGETFSASGLQVTAYDGANEDTANFKDVTESVTLGVADAYVFVDDDVPGKDVSVSYTEGTTKNTSFHIAVYALATYDLVTSAPSDWSGNYLLVASYVENEVTHNVAINSALVNFDQPLNFKEVSISDSSITTGQECEFTFASYQTGYSMQGKNGKYAYGDSSNRFMTSENPRALTLSFAENVITVTGSIGEKSSYVLMFRNTASRFGFYENGVSNISLYKLRTSSEADDYAQTFLSAFTCDNSGEEAPTFVIKEGETYWSWNLLKQAYNALASTSKEMFRLGVPSETGDNIAQALARYDLVVAKYKWENFMSRDIASLNQAGDMTNVTSDSSSYLVIIIVIIASIALDTIVIAHKKRKFKK